MRNPPLLLAAAVVLAPSCDCGSTRAPAPPAPAAQRPPSTIPPAAYLKGQLHLHSSRSRDSKTPPETGVTWYSQRHYDFIVFTDHNWVDTAKATDSMLVFPGVELTQNLETCDPPPEAGMHCLLHVDALFVTPPAEHRLSFPPPSPSARKDIYLRAVETAQALDGLAQLNHPNFHFAANIDVVMALAERGLTLIEIANMAVDSANEGNARHPSTEALWDEALTRGAHIFGTASDDAHHYLDADEARAHGETVYVGDRGFVMVHADKNEAAIRAAITRGDFYSSTGVMLTGISLTERELAVDVAPGDGAVTIEVIGDHGAVHAIVHGRQLRYDPTYRPSIYWRVRVTDAAGRHAWTQPLWHSEE